MSSRNANKRSDGRSRSLTGHKALCKPRENSNSISASPCSPPFSLGDVMGQPFIIIPPECGWCSINCLTKGNTEPPPSTSMRPLIMAPRETRSNVPMPSTDNNVAFASMSVNACATWAMHSLPALVDRANWKGAVANWMASFNCWANVRATSLRTKSPTTIPRTPPVGFCNAVATLHQECRLGRISRTRDRISLRHILNLTTGGGVLLSSLTALPLLLPQQTILVQLDEAKLVVLHITRQRLAGCWRALQWVL